MNLFYRFKTFTTLVLCICLFYTQVGPVYAEDNVNVESQEARQQQDNQSPSNSSGQNTDEESNNSSRDEMTSRTFSVKTEETDVGFSDMLVFILLIGIAAFILSIWKYEPMSFDMRVAMAAGLVMVVSVLMSIFNTRSKIDASTYKVEKKEDGTVNNMQLDALKEQREAYVALKDHAALKWKIEAAATAAFLAAAYYAWIASKKLKAKSVTCMKALTTNACPEALSIHKKEIAERWTPAPSDKKLRSRSKNVIARQKAIKLCKGPVQPPTPQTIAAGIAAVDAACLPEVSQLRFEEPFTVLRTDEKGDEIEEEIDLQGDEIDKVYEGSTTYLLPFLHMILEKEQVSLVKVSSLNELLNLQNISPRLGFIPSRFNETQNFNIDPKIEVTESNLDKVLNLFISKAHSFQFDIKLFGLSAGALLIFKGIRDQLVSWMDQWIPNPAHRRNLYLWASGISGAAATLSKISMGQAEDNIKKLDIMIEKMERLQNMSPSDQTLRQQDIGLASSLSPLEPSAPVSISPEGESLSCPRPLINGKCPSLETEIRESRDFGQLDPQFAGIAGLAGSAADGVVGSSSLGSGTVDTIDDLASNSALAKRGLRKLAENVNKERKANGEKPINIDDQIKLGARQLASIARKSLESSGSSPQQLLGSLGYRGNPEKPDEQKSVSLDEAIKQSGAVSSRGNPFEVPSSDDNGFNFSFGDEEQDEEEFFQGSLDQYDNSVYAKAFDAQKSSGSDQIVGDRDVSIFRVISVRYMKSGLPKLLESLTEKSSANELE